MAQLKDSKEESQHTYGYFSIRLCVIGSLNLNESMCTTECEKSVRLNVRRNCVGNDERYQLDATILFIIINNSTCFRHLYAHLQEYRLYSTAYGVQH